MRYLRYRHLARIRYGRKLLAFLGGIFDTLGGTGASVAFTAAPDAMPMSQMVSPNHGFSADQGPFELLAETGASLPTGLSEGESYWIDSVVGDDLFSLKDASDGSLVVYGNDGHGQFSIRPTGTAVAFTLADGDASSTKFTQTSHGYTAGDGPFELVPDSGATLPAGLSAGTLYWIQDVPDANTFTLMDAPDSGSAIAYTDAGEGTWKIKPTGLPIAFTLANNLEAKLAKTSHGFSAFDGPFLLSPDESAELPGGLEAGRFYWVASVPDANTFTLAYSRGGDTVTYSDEGSGTWKIKRADSDEAIFQNMKQSGVAAVAAADDVDEL